MVGPDLLAISVPLFGTGSDEGSEALPDNRVYLTWAGAWKTNRSSLNLTEGTSFLASNNLNLQLICQKK